MNNLTIRFSTLTPIWTAGVNGDSSMIKETGLIGSFRWWYEGIIRGMEGKACDPTDKEGACRFNSDKYKKANERNESGAQLLESAGLCPVCQFFGATGWQRRYRLEVEGLMSQPLIFKSSRNVYTAAGNWLWRMFGGEESGGKKEGKGKNVKFSFGVQTLWGKDASLRMIPIGWDADVVYARFSFLLNTIVRFGGIGAKTQNGFGQTKILSGLDPEAVSRGRELVKKDVEETKRIYQKTTTETFSFDRVFSRVYRLSNITPYINQLQTIGIDRPSEYELDFIPCAFDIRYKSEQKNPFTGEGRDFGMRPWFRNRWGKTATNRLFGRSNAKTDNERAAGLIRVSHIYKEGPEQPWQLKVWGYVPYDIQSDDRRRSGISAVIKDIDDFIMGPSGMFPGTEIVHVYNPEEVLKS